MLTAKSITMAVTILLLGASTAVFGPNTAAAQTESAMTLQSIANGQFQIPNLACGTLAVQLNDGLGSADGIDVVLGKVAFGSLGSSNKPAAVAHVAYHDETFGWCQELVFLTLENGKIVQTAEYSIDDRDQLQRFEIANGDVLVETAPVREPVTQHKVTKISVVLSKDAADRNEPAFTIKESILMASALPSSKSLSRNVKHISSSK